MEQTLKERLAAIILKELTAIANDQLHLQDLKAVADKVANQLTTGRAFLRSGRRVYDRLRERLLSR